MSDSGPAPLPTIAPEPAPLTGNSIVLVKNLGAVVLRFQYGGQWFIAPAGDQVAMPWDAACLWLGDPTLRDRPDGDSWHRYRTREAKRINLLWGMLNAPFYTNDPLARTQEDSHGDAVSTRGYLPLADLAGLGWQAPAGIAASYTHRHPNLPIVEVRHTSGGQQLIHMVVDDPHGVDDAVVQATLAASSVNAATADLAVKVAQQEQELAQMRAMMAALSPGLTSPDVQPAVQPVPVPDGPGQDTTINPPAPAVDPLSENVADVFKEERAAAQRSKRPPAPK